MFKKIIAVSAFGVSALAMMTANATTNGIYVTGQAGYAKTHMKNRLSFDPAFPGSKSMPNGGIAGRFAIGYQFNPNLAVELGYLQLSTLKATTPNIVIHGAWYQPGSITLKQNAIDVAAKGILPINDKFNVYGKLGVAYLTSEAAYLNERTGNNDNYGNDLGVAKHQWAPEAGIGLSFNITPNAFIDTSWTHIQPIGGKNKPGNIDFAAVGIGYSFG
ncbi:outer membrane beta-barrel protein [Rickettsiella endosymbiont of Rhagonycha lignosa]|uniref:outer membrane beta-barrel protein n=1 Tax=Rickettsiella endosymbiont of Rhagonycha lignosa TaxID=3077937 RepID=UPI00313E9BD4